jgi:hypothetical protein
LAHRHLPGIAAIPNRPPFSGFYPATQEFPLLHQNWRVFLPRRGLIIALVVLSLAGSYAPQWTDHNESDPGTTLLEAL